MGNATNIVNTTLDLFEYALITDLSRKVNLPMTVTLTDNRMNMISVFQEGRRLNVRLSRIFALAGNELVCDLADFITGRSKSVSPLVRKFIDSQPLPRRRGRKPAVKIRTKGVFYNLRLIANRLNRRYFGGGLKVRLTWGRSSSPGRYRPSRSIQYGSYDEHLDLIRIHPVLDSRIVPEEFLECVVYHEMLHKKLGFGKTDDGRRAIHTPEFKRLERAYEHYIKAVEWELKNFHRLLGLVKKSGLKSFSA